ncbi:substrate-binding domain-containing protein, partial [Bacillus sp. SIMBA_074]|uniref:substrate-binding domain-containing protein n=1 Tax=Bacillus sp. SIMBA_074 TaxID=3085812 RepID=UPI00397D2FB6
PFTHITIDNRAAARTATEHLLAIGCRRIAYIGRRDSRPSDAADRRHVGYVEALTAADIPVDPALTAQVDAFTADEGERVAAAMTAALPDLD